MAITAMWRSKRWEFVGILMAGSLSSAIEILDAGVGQGTVSLDEGSSLRLGLNPEWETISKDCDCVRYSSLCNHHAKAVRSLYVDEGFVIGIDNG
jgi:hypothetical protein